MLSDKFYQADVGLTDQRQSVGSFEQLNRAQSTDEQAADPTFVGSAYEDYSGSVLSGIDTLQEHQRSKTQRIFPQKLFSMLEYAKKNGLEDIICWQPSGRAFRVVNPKKFIAHQAHWPNQMNITKMTSFTRQLNLYHFKRITQGPDQGAYYHPSFTRNSTDQMLASMTRENAKTRDHTKDMAQQNKFSVVQVAQGSVPKGLEQSHPPLSDVEAKLLDSIHFDQSIESLFDPAVKTELITECEQVSASQCALQHDAAPTRSLTDQHQNGHNEAAFFQDQSVEPSACVESEALMLANVTEFHSDALLKVLDAQGHALLSD